MIQQRTPLLALVDETAAIYGVKGERVLAGGPLPRFQASVRYACIQAVRERWPGLPMKFLGKLFGIESSIIGRQRPHFMPKPQPFPEDVLREFCERHQIGIREILNRSMYPHLTALRRAAMCEVAERCPQLSYPDLGRLFKRDHSTIIYALGLSKRRKPPHAVR